jgi:hypothetical protein
MNLYFLVEGKRTEMKVYPGWLRYLAPKLRKVAYLEDVETNTYYIFSGEGYPSLLDTYLKPTIEEFLEFQKLDCLVVCLDVDDESCGERSREVVSRACSLGLPEDRLRVITQNSCIETWFLGNRKAVPTNPQNPTLGSYIQRHDVRTLDPELMGNLAGLSSRSIFHSHYFQLVAAERRFQYTKQRPGHLIEEAYLNELVVRTSETQHLGSFRNFLKLCDEINSRCI